MELNTIKEFCEELTEDVKRAYESSTSVEESEKLAAKFLLGQIKVGEALKSADLNARMRKSGLKAVKGAIYLEESKKGDKKPTEATLQALVDLNETVSSTQDSFDIAEVERNELENYLSVFRDAHIYFRALSKGRFE